jgi:cytochrome c biogenesis protein CcmG/thiol:disulfide interchange protein DsbE
VSTKRAGGINPRTVVLGAVALVIVIAVVVAVASSGGDDSGSAAAQETAAVKVEGSPLPDFPGNDAVDPAVGTVAPTLIGESFDESKVTIGPTGKPQVVVFLAHWCPHCQAEVPRLVAAAKAGQLAGIDVSAVTTSTSSEAPNYPPSAWLDREKWTFPVMVDSTSGAAGVAYGLKSFPYFVFLDGEGAVLGRSSGEVAPGALKAIFNALRDGKDLPLPTSGSSSSS